MELNLENRGLVLIEGKNTGNSSFESNGSGKSTLLNSITYAIYGQTSYGLRADDVVNRQEDKDTSVILYLDVDGQSYRIERYRKHKTHKNKVRLFQGNTELTGKSAKDTDTKIQELFGVDYNTYMNSIVQGQGEAEIFSKASDKGKKEILENITNIAVYKKAQDIAKEKVKERILDKQKIDRDIQEVERLLENLHEREAEDKANYQHTLNSIRESEERLERSENELLEHSGSLPEGLEDRLHYLSNERPPEPPNRPETTDKEWALQERLNNAKQHKEAQLERLKDNHRNEITEMKAKRTEIDKQVQPILTNVSVMKNEVARKNSEITRLDLSDTCPSCGQKVDKAHIQQEYERLAGEIQDTEQQIKYTEKIYNEELIPLIQHMEAEIASKETQYDNLIRTTEKQYNKDIDNLSIDIQTLREDIEEELREAYQQAQRDYQERMQERDQLQRTKTAFDSQKHNLEYAIKSERDMLDRLHKLPKPKDRTQEIAEYEEKLKESRTEYLACLDKIERYEDVVKLYSNAGVRSVVLDLVTPFLNEKANEYMATLSGSDIEILFTTQTTNKDGSISDKFDIEIINSNGGNLYKANSEGEKKRIDLAISFAIQDLVLSKSDMKTNIALYDEVFEGLDEIGSENVIKLLKDRQQRVESIFVITHDTHLKSMFENVITVEKKEGFTHLVSE